MNEYTLIYIVLVYRNYNDIIDFVNSVKEKTKVSFRIIAVESFYDDITSKKVQELLPINYCDYICVENHGYGYGNNCGINYAITKYKFKYIAICNPDILVESDMTSDLFNNNYDVIAPHIITISKKLQNPYWAYRNNMCQTIIYYGYKKDYKCIIYISIGINKVIRLFSQLYCKIINRPIRIYAAHGSFVMLSSEVIFKYGFRFDELMFLFYEEAYLAFFMRSRCLKTYYVPSLKIKHKEDGSMSISNLNEYDFLKQSYMYYYETYIKKPVII